MIDKNISNNLNENKIEDFDNICEQCKNDHENVSQNLILTGFKVCSSCSVSKTLFPV